MDIALKNVNTVTHPVHSIHIDCNNHTCMLSPCPYETACSYEILFTVPKGSFGLRNTLKNHGEGNEWHSLGKG